MEAGPWCTETRPLAGERGVRFAQHATYVNIGAPSAEVPASSLSAQRKMTTVGLFAVVGAVLAMAMLASRTDAPLGADVSDATQLAGKEETKEETAKAAPHKAKQEPPAPFAPLLYCWGVVRISGYEPELMNAQYFNQAGIFACDHHGLFSTGGVTQIGGKDTKEVVAPKSSMGDFSKAGTATDSWLNTMTFIKAWDMVIEDGTWWMSDWTVKVDPDAVFFPDRLRAKLEPHTGGLNAQPMWVGNCDRVWHSSKPHLKLFGSIEVFSRNAIGTYKAFSKQCQETMDWHGWGEDLFMQNCMEQMKVKAINGTDYLGDKRCYDAPCTDFSKVAYHDFKAVDTFFQCWGQSKGSERVYKEEQERLKREAEEREKERLMQEKLARERAEQERLRQEQLAKERAEAERIKQEQLVRVRAILQKKEAEKADQAMELKLSQEKQELEATLKKTMEEREKARMVKELHIRENGEEKKKAQEEEKEFEMFIRKRK